MTDLCDTAESTFMDYMFAGTSPPAAPSNIEISLHDSTLDTENPGANASEISGTGYSRQSTATGTDWSTYSTGDNAYGYENAVDITFGPFDASHTIEGFVVWDATNGNALFASTGISASVASGDELVFNTGDLSCKMD